MDKWLYFDVTHSAHLFCNTTDEATADELGRDATSLMYKLPPHSNMAARSSGDPALQRRPRPE